MRTKNLIAIAAIAVGGWLAASHINRVEAKYEQDVADYTAVLKGDTLPTQARMEAVKPTRELINLAKAVESYKTAPENQENLAEAASAVDTNFSNWADKLISSAMRYIGVPYRLGQSSPKGFDCSGFTSFVFKNHGIQLTRTSRSQYTEGAPVADVTQLKKGDLVFFGARRAAVGHVGIVTDVNPGNRSFRFIHASTSQGIRVSSSTEADHRSRYVGARRVLQ